MSQKYYQVRNFLTPEDHEDILTYAISRQHKFVPSATSTNEADYRKSLVLHRFPEVEGRITGPVEDMLPTICTALGLGYFTPSQIEAQMTAHGDRGYYKKHNDNGSPDTINRRLTYVYYFHQEPRPFEGGHLVIYDDKEEINIEPWDNSIVFFSSSLIHEVLPTYVKSQTFADSRFTINGWLRD